MLRATAVLAAMILVMVLGCGGPSSEDSDSPARQTVKYTQPSPDASAVGTSTVPGEPAIEPTNNLDSLVQWRQFRGPSMLAMDPLASVPIAWNRETDFLWGSEVLDNVLCRGASSPIVVGDRIYVTAYSGCGTSQQNRGLVTELKHHIICRDKHTGKQIWQRTIQGSPTNKRLSEHAFGHGFASSTPLLTNNRLFAFFGATGVFAFDLDGEFLWQTNVGSGTQDFGSSASLVGFKDLLFVNASVEYETLYAIDQSSGQAVWKLDNVVQSWCTPVIAETDDHKHELILNQQNWVIGLDPLTGEELWRCEGIDDYVVATPIVVDGICYVTGGKQHQTMAIRLGGRGDVSETHKLWQIRKGSNVCSLSHYQDVLYAISTNGVLQPIQSANGELQTRLRLGNSKEVLASPTIAGDHMFVPTQHRGVVVVNLLDQSEVVARNEMFEEDPLKASLAVSENCLYLRTDNCIYCIGRTSESTQPVAELEPSGDRDIIQPKGNFSIDPKTNRPKTFLRCLVTEPSAILDFMLVPYKSVITDEQTEKSTEYILANHQPFIEMRRQYNDLRWEYLRGRLDDDDYAAKVTAIEKLALQHNRKVRTFIKEMFSEEQMDQHLREAGIVRKKPPNGS